METSPLRDPRVRPTRPALDALAQRGVDVLHRPSADAAAKAESTHLIDIEGCGQPQEGRGDQDEWLFRAYHWSARARLGTRPNSSLFQ